ncbi:hypothetical protein PHMEG_00033646 [Phytophthora megakarya]|uniref:RNase H type-1 domain-containing protein n=1 Tax=Phytophthora megakarya TaxID=4795 RepID=A0A225USZ1_9STRA|nr:hypothetical protein PHMEG_00033646 [Phytophthora megakarya]
MLEQCWSLGAALMLEAVWRWRVSHFDALNNTSAEHHKALLVGRLRNGYMVVRHHSTTDKTPDAIAAALAAVRQGLVTEWVAVSTRTPMRNLRYLLFFAGALDEEHHGGAGAVVAQVGMSLVESMICWIDMAPDKPGTQTTKYRMEHLGLLHGLTACYLHRWAPLYVVGSSNVIIQQHMHTPPKKKTMATIF